MARIAFLDDSFPFTGKDLRTQPLGGIQTATVSLAEALAERGHKVTILGMVTAPTESYGVTYRPLNSAKNETFDCLISNCAPKLFRVTKATQRVLWLHGPARYMRKPRHFLPYLRYRPALVFLGSYHEGTWPRWLPRFAPTVIPHGVGTPFIDSVPTDKIPAPRALFLSNPRRGLDWVVSVWKDLIAPQFPEARLAVYAGRSNYGNRSDPKLDEALKVLENAAAFGIESHDPQPKSLLAQEMARCRVMLYRGDLGETFCFAAAEAQAMGLPLVTCGVGALAERVKHGITGFLAPDREAFAAHALRLLRDDALWRVQHEAALAQRSAFTWQNCAQMWEQKFLNKA